ncbi:DUF4870 domain-containing protein [Methanobrevibacter sp.]|uniref:DUF4870 domain-containing protein n=1 Tax=Methanobrevibacter sp. TaxID=66852 RepID=UPI00386CDC85
MDSRTIIAIIGYILAILFPLIGVIYGLILYFVKGDDEYIKKHAKYIIIVGVIMMIISIVLAMVMGISLLAIGASQ